MSEPFDITLTEGQNSAEAWWVNTTITEKAKRKTVKYELKFGARKWGKTPSGAWTHLSCRGKAHDSGVGQHEGERVKRVAAFLNSKGLKPRTDLCLADYGGKRPREWELKQEKQANANYRRAAVVPEPVKMPKKKKAKKP